MISGASDEELDIAIARTDVLLELQPKIDELKKENQQLKEIINKAKDLIKSNPNVFYDEYLIDVETILKNEFYDDYVGEINFMSKLIEILDNKGE